MAGAISGAATEKTCFSGLSLVLETGSCCEVDDLSYLVMFDRCRSAANVGLIIIVHT